MIKNFSELGITTKKSFEGPKGYPDDILGKKITVEFFDIRKSKKNDGTDCLYLQIIDNGEKRLIFSSSTFLMDQLKRLDQKEDFPFYATIIKVNRHFEFK